MHTLFIADDELDKFTVLRSNPNWQKYDISICGEAYDGNRTYEELIRLNPDIALIDINMPGMSGLDAIRKAKSHNLKTKYIILTGYDDFKFVKTALELKSVDYLLKPSRIEEIVRTVLKAVNEIEEERQLFSSLIKKFKDNSGAPNSADERESDHIAFPENPVRNALKSERVSLQIQSAMKYIRQHYAEKISLETAAAQSFISPAYLSQLFKQQTGMNFIEYLNHFRIEKSKELLSDPGKKIYNVAYECGFSDEKYFHTIFRKYTGITPNQYRDTLIL
ncbi:response regulator transcription factor [Treponema brennaborense]|uniref:Two component transcriptional regulator, AraC family n=1 Tax=Treponema brennaborense (strain DSM 12168 / CIP 105900 / DD5/3) TaxID=906968 RepID=F4LMY2_TREBD|nr:helix-turn-helix domain-containing protein [Treponema brennaborense]AEE15768.1 two component transcriptional regulator, AraC family [Treponema brennaborense DSM 12168]